MKRETVPRSTRGWVVVPARGWLMLAAAAAFAEAALTMNRLRFAIARLASIQIDPSAALTVYPMSYNLAQRTQMR